MSPVSPIRRGVRGGGVGVRGVVRVRQEIVSNHEMWWFPPADGTIQHHMSWW
jgi:hypothetical protein